MASYYEDSEFFQHHFPIARGDRYWVMEDGTVLYISKNYDKKVIFTSKNGSDTVYYQYKHRLVQAWKRAEIGKKYDFGWGSNAFIKEAHEKSDLPVFLGFKENCSICNQLSVEIKDDLIICMSCNYVHGVHLSDEL